MKTDVVEYKGYKIEYKCIYGDCGWVVDGYNTIFFTLDGAKEEIDEWIEEAEYVATLSDDEKAAYYGIDTSFTETCRYKCDCCANEYNEY